MDKEIFTIKNLRKYHLYLGCFFAPMLLFFAISGLWQLIDLNFESKLLTYLSTIHTSATLKNGITLSSPLLMIFIGIMSFSFIAMIVLGIIMAFRFGNRKSVQLALASGFILPLIIVLYTLATLGKF